jgi:acyl-CoA synthetase (NDP forming)
LASVGAAIDAAFAAAGVLRVRTPRELVDVAQALLRCPPSRGRRVAVLGDGGGHVSIAAAEAMHAGLDVPELSETTVVPLRASLPAAAGVSNPIDLAGAAEQDVHVFDRLALDLLAGGEVDALLVTGYFGGYAEYGPDTAEDELRTAELMGAAASATGRPLVTQTMYPHGPAAQALRRAGVPVYESVEQAAGALAALAAQGALRPQAIPELPVSEAPEPVVAATGDGYLAARALLAAAGIRFVALHQVASAEEAVAAALQIGYPVVLKALGQTHKSDAGGVVLNIASEGQLRAAYAQVQRAVEPERCTVEQMAPLTDGLELLIGARWDPRFGPVALAGSGGLYAEILRDTAVRLAPVTEPEAEAMLRTLRIAPLLTGARGRPPLDIGAAASALAALSHVAAAHPELTELEINPLLVTRAAAVALDARFIKATPSQERESAVHLHP